MIKIHGGYVGPTPVFTIAGGINTQNISRASYGVFKGGVFYFPAFPPFLDIIVRDLEFVFPNQLEFNSVAKGFLKDSLEITKAYTHKKVTGDYRFKTSSYSHQRELLNYGLSFPRSLIQAEPGLGKSKVAIDGISFLKKKALVIAPASLVPNWIKEIKEHYTGDVKVNAVYGKSEKKRNKALGIHRKYQYEVVRDAEGEPVLTKSGKGSKKKVLVEERYDPIDCDILIVGYEVATINLDHLIINFPFEVLVVDEIHRCKGYKSKRTVAVNRLAQKCHYRWGLTGSSVLGDPRDIYSQLNILSPAILNEDYFKFCSKYLVKAPHNQHIVTGYKNMDRLNKVIKRHSIRYRIDDCLDLPDRRILNITVPMSDEQDKMITDIESTEDMFLDGGNIPKEHAIVGFGKLQQVTGGFLYLSTKDLKLCDGCHNVVGCIEAKPVIKPYTKFCHKIKKAPPVIIKRLKDNPKMGRMKLLLEDILSYEDNKIIVWAKYTEELKMIKELLDAMSIKYVSIGEDPSASADILRDDKETKILIGNISQGIGFTANAANYMIYYSLSYKYEDWVQSLGRNRRINQKRKQTVYVLNVENSIDERAMKALDAKKDVVETLLENLNCFTCRHRINCMMQGINRTDKGCLLS